MIRAKIVFDKDSCYKEFNVSGHAEYDEYGHDIVCASVSVLVINTANAIEKLTDAEFQANQEENLIRFIFYDKPDEKSKLLMDAMILGLNEIQKSYGKKYLKLETEKISGGN